jgi:EAL domain-containing protein (putative c-di-GMP-specific phosphodiesterase class I)
MGGSRYAVRLFARTGKHDDRLVWSRDERLINNLSQLIPDARVVPLSTGAALIGPDSITDILVSSISGTVPYGLVSLDPRIGEPDRSLAALADAIQQSRIADRVGMITSPTAASHRIIDLFVARRAVTEIRYQPIVDLGTFEAAGYEALCRPSQLAGSITEVVEAAVACGRTVEIDRLISDLILARTAALDEPPHVSINVLPASLADPWFEAARFARHCRDLDVHPTLVTLECTEQQTAPDVDALARRVQRLRRQGFGFAIDDAGAGYASFALIAALRPTVIKIDAQIVRGLAHTDAKQALVEAFVGFARRIDARLVAEGIQTNADLDALKSLGVGYGQGYLLGRPQISPQRTRRPRNRRHVGVVVGRRRTSLS